MLIQLNSLKVYLAVSKRKKRSISKFLVHICFQITAGLPKLRENEAQYNTVDGG